jgi:hypothetical protein
MPHSDGPVRGTLKTAVRKVPIVVNRPDDGLREISAHHQGLESAGQPALLFSAVPASRRCRLQSDRRVRIARQRFLTLYSQIRKSSGSITLLRVNIFRGLGTTRSAASARCSTKFATWSARVESTRLAALRALEEAIKNDLAVSNPAMKPGRRFPSAPGSWAWRTGRFHLPWLAAKQRPLQNPADRHASIRPSCCRNRSDQAQARARIRCGRCIVSH